MTDIATETSVAASTVDANGLSTTFRRSGSGAPLLFLGNQGYASAWLPIFDVLAADFDVIVPEHPGFADTELPDDLVDFADLSAHYATFLDALGTGPVHLVGHGFGGWVAAEFAAFFPERVRSLTLIAPSGLRPDADEPMLDAYRVDRDQWLALALGADHDRWAGRSDASAVWADQMLSDYKERIGVARVAWNPRYSIRLERRLGRVAAPAQVLVPEQDQLIAPSIARRYTELLGLDGVDTIVGDGYTTQHQIVVQEPAKIAAKVVGIARSAAGASSS